MLLVVSGMVSGQTGGVKPELQTVKRKASTWIHQVASFVLRAMHYGVSWALKIEIRKTHR